MWKLRSLKSYGQATRLEISAGVDVEGFSEGQSGHRIPSSSRDLSLFLRASTNWIRPIYITEDNLPYSTFIDLNVNHI